MYSKQNGKFLVRQRVCSNAKNDFVYLLPQMLPICFTAFTPHLSSSPSQIKTVAQKPGSPLFYNMIILLKQTT
jgi:hypothetical protein